MLTKKDKEVWATSGQGYLFSQIFKPITTVRRQVTKKGNRTYNWTGRETSIVALSTMFILTCLSTRSIVHSIPLHHHLTTCRSYRPENFWKQISLSRRCPDFLIFFGINFSGSQTSQSFLSLTLEIKMLRKTNSIGSSKNALYVKKVQADEADECFMLSYSNNVNKIGLSMVLVPLEVLCLRFSCRKPLWTENWADCRGPYKWQEGRTDSTPFSLLRRVGPRIKSTLYNYSPRSPTCSYASITANCPRNASQW